MSSLINEQRCDKCGKVVNTFDSGMLHAAHDCHPEAPQAGGAAGALPAEVEAALKWVAECCGACADTREPGGFVACNASEVQTIRAHLASLRSENAQLTAERDRLKFQINRRSAISNLRHEAIKNLHLCWLGSKDKQTFNGESAVDVISHSLDELTAERDSLRSQVDELRAEVVRLNSVGAAKTSTIAALCDTADEIERQARLDALTEVRKRMPQSGHVKIIRMEGWLDAEIERLRTLCNNAGAREGQQSPTTPNT